jgi:L-fucose mutarotase
LLRGISKIISPELMKIMMEMGHGDELVIADGNFPASSLARRLVRADGHLIVPLLEAIMPLFPLDHAVERPAAVMSLLAGDATPPVWDYYRNIIQQNETVFKDFEYVERFAFYARAREAYAVIVTGDQSFKGNLILKKGVVRD